MEEKEAPAQEATQQFSNDNVSFSIHRKPSCRVEFEVTASPLLVAEAHKKAIKAITKEVSLPGFRKGKAPEQLVVKNYHGQIDKQWQEIIADLAFKESDKLAKVPLLSREASVNYEMKGHSKEGAKLIFSFETEPEVPVIDPKNFQVKEVKRPEVNEEKVEETIRQIQLFLAEWKPITDRPVQEGDFVRLDVDLIEEPASNLFTDTRFEVTDKSMAKWMKDLVIGQQKGASIEGVSTPDEDAKPEDKENLKPKKVRITIKAIEEAKAPPVDDQLATQLGAGTLDEMRKRIHDLLNKQADSHVKEALREQATEFLLSHNFDLPTSLIYREAQFRMKQLQADNQFIEYWNSLSQEDQKNTTQSILKQAEKAVRMFYICRKIVADHKISVTANDVPPPVTNLLEAFLSPKGAHAHHPQPEMHQAEMYSRLVLEKAEDFVIAHGTVA